MTDFIFTLSIIALCFCIATTFVALIVGSAYKLLNALSKITQCIE